MGSRRPAMCILATIATSTSPVSQACATALCLNFTFVCGQIGALFCFSVILFGRFFLLFFFVGSSCTSGLRQSKLGVVLRSTRRDVSHKPGVYLEQPTFAIVAGYVSGTQLCARFVGVRKSHADFVGWLERCLGAERIHDLQQFGPV